MTQGKPGKCEPKHYLCDNCDKPLAYSEINTEGGIVYCEKCFNHKPEVKAEKIESNEPYFKTVVLRDSELAELLSCAGARGIEIGLEMGAKVAEEARVHKIQDVVCSVGKQIAKAIRKLKGSKEG